VDDILDKMINPERWRKEAEEREFSERFGRT